MPSAYTDERLLQILRDLAAELGRAPTSSEMQARRDLPSICAYRGHFGSWGAALKAAGLEPYHPGPVYTDAQLLQILRDLATELGRTPTERDLQARRGLPSSRAYYGHFGSWTAAREAAGLEPYRRPPTFVYSDEQLLQILRDLAAELGRSPTEKEMKARRDLPSVRTYYARFGNWSTALKAAGMEISRRRSAHSDEQLLQALRDLAAALGRAPTSSEMRARRDLPGARIYYARFGSWIAALKAAGLERRRPPEHSDAQLVQILRDLAAELGRSPTDHEMQARRDLPSVKIYYKRFGGWNASLEAAGLETRHYTPPYSDEQLLQTLRDLAAELGRSPTSGELLARRGLPSLATYQAHFGNWSAALEAAGLEIYRRPSTRSGPARVASPAYSEAQLLQILRDLAAELGRSPMQRELRARRDLPSISAYRGHFGSWSAALEAAGLEPYRRPSTRTAPVRVASPAYSDAQLLQILRDLAAELGRSPTINELRARRDLPTINAYYRRFGNWTAALEAAGLEPCHRRPSYTDAQLLQTLRDLAVELGRPPTINEVLARADLPTPATFINRFGGWNAALEAAGLEVRYHNPVYTDAQLLQTLRDLAAELGRSPLQQELQARRDLPSVTAYRGHFGSWDAALEAAGLEPYSPPPAHTAAQLLQILRDLAAELGRTPTQRELQARRDLPSITAYYEHFGRWNTALEAAGLKPNRRPLGF